MPYDRPQTHSTRGFTLLELMVTLAVAAILISVAVPAFNSVFRRNRVTVARNKLIGALSLARSAAVMQGRAVAMCKSADGGSCTPTGDWAQGWLVYTPEPGQTAIANDSVLRVQGAFSPQLTITGNSHVANTIAFDALGFAYGKNGTLTIAHAGSGDQVKVIISNTGRVRVEAP